MNHRGPNRPASPPTVVESSRSTTVGGSVASPATQAGKDQTSCRKSVTTKKTIPRAP
jgi:hypothetical protein